MSNPITGYKILILHAIRVDAAKTTLDHLYCYPAYCSGNLYVYHHIQAPITQELISFPFDALIINYCFLAQRDSNLYLDYREKFAFVKEMQAMKIAISMDDYTLNDVLDDWLMFLGVDLIYSAVIHDLNVLYPRCSSCIPIKRALTGYSHGKDLARLSQFVTPFFERAIDVGTRVRYLAPYFGRAGIVKGRAAERFGVVAVEAGFAVDISTNTNDFYDGDDWFRFLGSCRFTIAARGGASLNDPRGMIRTRVIEFLRKNPDARFEEVEAACFPGLDGHDFGAVSSSRIFEAAAARTGLILLEGHYVDGLEPYRHYIPLKADFSNLDEVFALMRDDAVAQRMIEAAYEYLVVSERFSYGVFVADVLGEMAARRPVASPATTDDAAILKRRLGMQRRIIEAPPHWTRIACSVAKEARQRGQLAALADLLAATRRGADLRSAVAAEIACLGTLDPRLAGLAVETIKGLAGNEPDLPVLSSILAAASQQTAADDFDYDWQSCGYIYEPRPD